MPQRSGSLRGFWFHCPGGGRTASRRREVAASGGSEGGLGFFVGYLVRPQEYTFLNPELPECLVFAFVAPVGGSAHGRLVSQPGSLLRRTFEYIRWLTHRPPRFVFLDGERAALVRHQSMRDWPRGKHEHFSRNFFIETLAWLVRSGLVRKLLAETTPGRRAEKPAQSPTGLPVRGLSKAKRSPQAKRSR